jgi:hypothetical protein
VLPIVRPVAGRFCVVLEECRNHAANPLPSLATMVSQPFGAEVRKTHADTVTRGKFSAAVCVALTRSFTPSNDAACPKRPAAKLAPPAGVPWCVPVALANVPSKP